MSRERRMPEYLLRSPAHFDKFRQAACGRHSVLDVDTVVKSRTKDHVNETHLEIPSDQTLSQPFRVSLTAFNRNVESLQIFAKLLPDGDGSQ
jgi:hypothetical protein